MTTHAFAIAIDGPVASGKGTIAKLLAHQLHGFHLNTGAMYRALTLYCLQNDIDIYDSTKVVNALSEVNLSLQDDSIVMNGKDVTEEIKEPSVTKVVPIVATIKEVREEMVKRQRAIGMEKIDQGQIVLVDARDGATKIFPDAKLKIFLTASAEVRAKRRLIQLGGKNYEQMFEDIKKRDQQDMQRKAAPLVSDPEKYDYFVIDNSNLTKDDTIGLILGKLKYDTH